MRGYLSGGWWFLRFLLLCSFGFLLPFPFVDVEAMAMVGFLRVLGGKSAFFGLGGYVRVLAGSASAMALLSVSLFGSFVEGGNSWDALAMVWRFCLCR